MTDWRSDFATPKFVVALAAIAVFGWAYGQNVDDKTMLGAIIGGFNLALGFYLGSTNSASKSTENVGKAFDAVTATANASTGNGVAAKAADQVADAAASKADEIAGAKPPTPPPAVG